MNTKIFTKTYFSNFYEDKQYSFFCPLESIFEHRIPILYQDLSQSNQTTAPGKVHL